MAVGTRLKCNEVFLEITQIGKECHNHCAIYKQMGDCIMPREGVFARVLHGGKIQIGDELKIFSGKIPLDAAIITSSDKGFSGEREDLSGAKVSEILTANGYKIFLKYFCASNVKLLQ